MRFVIVTGLSGAGKTQTIRNLEDLGYFCVDNLPSTLIPKFAELCNQSGSKIDKIALVIDIRSGKFFDDFFESLDYLKKNDLKYEILFLDADDETLVKRFKESRRKHPLAPDGRIINGITLEREKLKNVQEISDEIINTSKLSVRELREIITKTYGESEKSSQLMITVLSFGFKYGVPVDADLVFDVRFLPNPFYIPELKRFSGNEKPVSDYVLGHEETMGFIRRLNDLLEFLIPNYVKEGKKQIIIAFGCTGGRHRSVAIANEIYRDLLKNGHKATIEHRDIDEDINRSGNKL